MEQVLMDRTSHCGVTKNAGRLINVMANCVGPGHHASRADTLTRTSLVNAKNLITKMEQFNAI